MDAKVVLLWTIVTLGLVNASGYGHQRGHYGIQGGYGYGGYPSRNHYGSHSPYGFGNRYGGGFGNLGLHSPYGSFGGYGHNPYNDHYGHGYDDEDDEEEVEQVCTTTHTEPMGTEDLCSLKPDPGTCGHLGNIEKKWFFNYVEGECQLFTYSGCDGNDNRFDTKDGCTAYCLGQPVTTCKEVSKKSKKKKHGKRKHPFSHYRHGTKHRIDAYLAKSYLLGKRRLNVELDYLNTPLEWQYLNQYHKLQHPLAYTNFAPRFGLNQVGGYAAPQGYSAQTYSAPQGYSAQGYAAPQGYSAQAYAAPQGYSAQTYSTPQGYSAQTYTAPKGYSAQTYSAQGYSAPQTYSAPQPVSYAQNNYQSVPQVEYGKQPTNGQRYVASDPNLVPNIQTISTDSYQPQDSQVVQEGTATGQIVMNDDQQVQPAFGQNGYNFGYQQPGQGFGYQQGQGN